MEEFIVDDILAKNNYSVLNKDGGDFFVSSLEERYLFSFR